MKRIGISELRYDFPNVEKMLLRGEEIEVTRRNKVIAKLMPVAEMQESLLRGRTLQRGRRRSSEAKS